jgi:hypothetical protein
MVKNKLDREFQDTHDISVVFREFQSLKLNMYKFKFISKIYFLCRTFSQILIKKNSTHNSSLCLCDKTMVYDIRTDYFPLIAVCSDH